MSKFWEVVIENPLPWEKIELLIKRHWIVYFGVFLMFLWWIVLTSILWYFFHNNLLFILLTIVFWMFYILFLYVKWLDHELDLFIVTTERIVWIEQVSLLNRTVSECALSQVEEVWSQTKWLLANFFNYWSILIQTAWNNTSFFMDYVEDPIWTSRKIHNIINKYRNDKDRYNEENKKEKIFLNREANPISDTINKILK